MKNIQHINLIKMLKTQTSFLEYLLIATYIIFLLNEYLYIKYVLFLMMYAYRYIINCTSCQLIISVLSIKLFLIFFWISICRKNVTTSEYFNGEKVAFTSRLNATKNICVIRFLGFSIGCFRRRSDLCQCTHYSIKLNDPI